MEKFNESEKPFRAGASGPKYFVNGPFWDGGVILLEPGGCIAEHGHRAVEETFYFLEGGPLMTVDKASFRAGPGDVVRVFAGETHSIRNDSNKPARIMFIKAPYSPQDKYVP